MENRKYKQLIVRIKYNTFVKLKKAFPALHNESMASYFERLESFLNKKYTFGINDYLAEVEREK